MDIDIRNDVSMDVSAKRQEDRVGSRIGADHVGLAGLALWLTFILGLAILRWRTFQYGTFDVTVYIHAIHEVLRGNWMPETVLLVPLMGHHVDPIVYAFAPLMAVAPHPLVFPVIQAVWVSSMAIAGRDYCIGLGLPRRVAWVLAITLLCAPAVVYACLHEFHPETLALPGLLFLYRARQTNRLGRYWLWFLFVLACKENMALLLCAIASIDAWQSRRRGWSEVFRWGIGPFLAGAAWFVVCMKVIAPAWNSEGIDFAFLYHHLGATPAEAVKRIFSSPGESLAVLARSMRGSLLWGTLLPLAGLPLASLSAMWAAAPLYAQHLLSSRSSEWEVYYHYAAPFMPVLWCGAIRLLARPRFRRLWIAIPIGTGAAIILAGIPRYAADVWRQSLDPGVGIREEALALVNAEESVTATMGFLAHLGWREDVRTLHLVLKGTKPLGFRRVADRPPTDAVLIDYSDRGTFTWEAGFLHPSMRTNSGEVIESSAMLLHQYLAKADWRVSTRDSVSVMKQGKGTVANEPEELVEDGAWVSLNPGTRLGSVDAVAENNWLVVRSTWEFDAGRTWFPWVTAVFRDRSGAIRSTVTRGWIGIEKASSGAVTDVWRFRVPGDVSLEGTTVDFIVSDLDAGLVEYFSGKSPTLVLKPVAVRRVAEIAPSSR